MSILVSAALLSTCMGQVGTTPTYEERLGAFRALVGFVREHKTTISDLNLCVDDFRFSSWDPKELGTLQLQSYRPNLRFSARRMSKRWVIRWFSDDNVRPNGAEFQIRELPELEQLTLDAFGALIRRYRLALDREEFQGKHFAIISYSTPTVRWEKSKHASLYARWRTTDSALAAYKVWPVPDPDL